MQTQRSESVPLDCYDDNQLIEQFQNGDTAAFDTLFTRYQKRTYRLVQRFVSNPEDASDLTQDAFIRAYQGLGDFKSQCQFYSWLYRITVNLCIDFLRKNQDRKCSYTTPTTPANCRWQISRIHVQSPQQKRLRIKN